MGSHSEMISFMQRFLGYGLTGTTGEQCFVFLYGSGANGKSTLLDVLSKMMDQYACQAQPETFMEMKRASQQASSDIARLAGKRVVISNEVTEGEFLADNLIKQLTGGDKITARYMYGEPFEFQPKFKLFMAGNHRPIVRGTDNGIWRRILLVPFDQVIPEALRDKQLAAKLAHELPGILNWAIKGCLDWATDGLKVPAKITDASKSYRSDMDLFGSWLDDECDRGISRKVPVTLLFQNYRNWCEQSIIRPLSKPVFDRQMVNRGFVRDHTRTGNFWLGLDLKTRGVTHSAPIPLALVASA